MNGTVTGNKVGITIVNVALNDIRASFGTPIDQIGWVSTRSPRRRRLRRSCRRRCWP